MLFETKTRGKFVVYNGWWVRWWLKLTLLTNDLAASSMLTFSLADVSNHPANPCSLTYSSSLAGVVTIPCFCWSLYVGGGSRKESIQNDSTSYREAPAYVPCWLRVCTEWVCHRVAALLSQGRSSTWSPHQMWRCALHRIRWMLPLLPCSTRGSCCRIVPDLKRSEKAEH